MWGKEGRKRWVGGFLLRRDRRKEFVFLSRRGEERRMLCFFTRRGGEKNIVLTSSYRGGEGRKGNGNVFLGGETGHLETYERGITSAQKN